VCVVFAGLGVAAGANPKGPERRSSEPLEALFGTYDCSGNADGGWIWSSFESTGDIVHNNLSFYREITFDGASPAAVCDADVSNAVALVQRLGCVAGDIVQYEYDDGGSLRSFRFICKARRSRIVSILADFGEHVLTSTVP
jgi:hypothetical protein